MFLGDIMIIVSIIAIVILFNIVPGYIGVSSLIDRIFGRKKRESGQRCCINIDNKCYYLYRIYRDDCILGLLRSGALLELMRDSNLSGIFVVYERVQLHKALREIEAKILTYRVELERNPDNLRAKQRLELLEYIYKELSRLNDPIKPTLLIVLDSEAKLSDIKKKLSIYRCGIKSACSFLLNRRKPIISRNSIAINIIQVLNYAYSLLALQSSSGFLIGYEMLNNTPVKLPMWSNRLGALHTLIVGPSGRGKTTLLARLVFESIVKENYCLKVIDPKGDLEELIGRIMWLGNLEIYDSSKTDLINLDTLLDWPSKCRYKVVIGDEAWRVISELGSKYDKLIRSARSLGINLVLASQQPEDFPQSMWNNSHNFIVFGSSSPSYIESIKRFANISEEEASQLLRLGIGEALLKHFKSMTGIFFRAYTPPITVKNPGEGVGKAGRRVLSYGQAIDYPA